MFYKPGQRPGEGLYQCLNCKKKVKIAHDHKALPRCTKCGIEAQVRYRKVDQDY